MSMTTLSDPRNLIPSGLGSRAGSARPDGQAFDDGLEHHHHWARERAADGQPGPVTANAASARTPSTALHDDAHYSAV